MNHESMIYMAVSYRATSVAYIARELGMTKQVLYKKMRRDTLKKEDLKKIAKLLRGRYLSCIILDDGIVIGDRIKRKTAKKKDSK